MPNGESPTSAKQHCAGEEGSEEVPQTFLAAHKLHLLAGGEPGDASVELLESSQVLDSLKENGKRITFMWKRGKYTDDKVNEINAFTRELTLISKRKLQHCPSR